MTQKTKHTPAPWVIEWDKYGKSSEVFGGEGEICEPVCIILHDDITTKGEKEMKANARLIAAAPDLLEALKEHHRIALEYSGDAYAGSACRLQTEDAIAKAEGK